MCRLFGLYSNTLVDVYFSFFESPSGGLVELSHSNPDGWGIAWFSESGWKLYKEPMPLYSSNRAKDIIQKVRGRIIVSHVRNASVGGRKKENTHPWLYRGWVFAHNGTIDREELLKLLSSEYSMDLEGDTDSEVFFHLIIQEVEGVGNPVKGIINAIKRITNSGVWFKSLNFIASDSKKLYALRYVNTNQDYYTLFYVERPREGLKLRRLSRETQQLIEMKLVRGEKAIIIASEPMSDEPYWRLIPNKQLVIVDENLNVERVDIG